jgi:hypothetical protein
MALHNNQNPFTSQPIPASVMNFAPFDDDQGFFEAFLPPQAP